MKASLINEANFIHEWKTLPLDGKTKIGAAVDGRGNITFGLEVIYPAVFQLNRDRYSKFYNDLLNLMSATIEGCYLQFLDFYYIEQNDLMEDEKYLHKKYSTKYNFRQFDGKGILKHKSFLFFTYEYVITENIGLKYAFNAGSPKQTVLKNVDPDKYGKHVSRVLSDFKSKAMNINSVDALGIKLLTEKGMKKVVGNFMNQSYDDWNNRDLTLQPVNSTLKNLIVGNKYVGVNTVSSFPETLMNYTHNGVRSGDTYENGIDFANKVDLPKSFVYPLGLGLPINHVISTVIGFPGVEAVKNRVKSEYSDDRILSFFHKTDFEKKKIEVVDLEGQIGSGMFFQNISNNNYTPVSFAQNVFTYGRTEEELFEYQEFVSQAITHVGKGAGSIKENGMSLHFFKGSCPGLIRNNRIGNSVMTLNQALTLIPRETHLTSDSRGFLYTDRSGNPLIIDFRIRPLGTRLSNRNRAVFGRSGSGKSVWGNDYLSQAYNLSYHLLTLDVGGSYKRNALQMGLKYIDSGEEDEFCFNPILSCPRRNDGTFIYKVELKDENLDDAEKKAAKFVLNAVYAVIDAIISDPAKPVDKDTKIGLITAIEKYYDHLNDKILNGIEVTPGITDYTNFIKEYSPEFDKEYGVGLVKWKSIFLRLSPFAYGQHKEFLNAPEVIDVFSDRGVIIDAEQLNKMEDKRNVGMICICQLAVMKLEQLPLDVPKIFFLDEAVDFLTGDVGDFIAGLYRKIRKVGGEIILATQDSKFLKSAKPLVIDSILSNTSTKILLGSDKKSIDDAKYLLSLDDDDLEKIGTMDQSKYEFFCKFENDSYILRNLQSKEAVWVYTTNPDDRPIIDKKVEKYNGNVEVAVNELIKEQNQ